MPCTQCGTPFIEGLCKLCAIAKDAKPSATAPRLCLCGKKVEGRGDLCLKCSTVAQKKWYSENFKEYTCVDCGKSWRGTEFVECIYCKGKYAKT